MKMISVIAVTMLLFLMAINLYGAQTDNPKCKDHPMFTRMPGSWIYNCDHKQFDGRDFKIVRGKNNFETIHVEGQLWWLTYYPQNNLKTKPSELQIHRNFENAVQKLGGTLIGATDKNRQVFKLAKDGKEIWIEQWAEFTGKHGFTIIQKEAMAQDVVGNAQVFSNDIRTTGHAVYGIYFDTGRSDIKPESAAAISEIAKLLKSDPGLKIHVVGHTDNVGGVDSNIKLSQSRAEAVIQALVRNNGIASARLRAFGCGQFAPVTTNDTDSGRAKNRRVELVKQ